MNSYHAERASQYDEQSFFDKGDRERHIQLLEDILSYQKATRHFFIELGCGTGYFTSVLERYYAGQSGVLVDGSLDMLEVAHGKLGDSVNLKYEHCLLEELEFNRFPKPDLVFSALTIHHLPDNEKKRLYSNIYKHLTDDGLFIYFDQFVTEEKGKDLFLEYLACRDIQRRLIAGFGSDLAIEEFKIEEIILKDRLVKRNENDQEATLTDTLKQLKETGFEVVLVVYQESRFFAITAFKRHIA